MYHNATGPYVADPKVSQKRSDSATASWISKGSHKG